MKNILVVYDSVFGNTEKVAQAISKALETAGTVTTLKATAVNEAQMQNLDLLVVGSPTRGFRPTPEVMQFLKTISTAQVRGVKTAAFDTRVALEVINPKIFQWMINTGGYAAAVIAKRLARKGAKLAGKPEGFFVTGEADSLKENELERAAAWAQSLIN